MKKALILFISISFLGINDTIAQSKKELKKQQLQKEYQLVKQLIEKGDLLFKPDWASTHRGKRINLSGDGYTLKIEGDKITADLPFFGRAYSAPYGGSGGIKFDIENTVLDIDYNDKKNRVTIKFKAKHESEYFDVQLIVFSNKSASLRVSSSNRSHMNFDGKIKEIQDKKDE